MDKNTTIKMGFQTPKEMFENLDITLDQLKTEAHNELITLMERETEK